MQNAHQLAKQYSLYTKKCKMRTTATLPFSVSPFWCLLAGRVDSLVIDSDVTNYTLSSLFPATEYEISLNAVRGSQESKVVSTSVFTGGLISEHNYEQ